MYNDRGALTIQHRASLTPYVKTRLSANLPAQCQLLLAFLSIRRTPPFLLLSSQTNYLIGLSTGTAHTFGMIIYHRS